MLGIVSDVILSTIIITSEIATTCMMQSHLINFSGTKKTIHANILFGWYTVLAPPTSMSIQPSLLGSESTANDFIASRMGLYPTHGIQITKVKC